MALAPGTIVVADSEAFGGSGGVIAVDPGNGRQSTISSGGLFADPAGIAFLGDGRILVSDLTAFGGGGGLIFVDPDTGRQEKAVAATEFLRPFGIAVEPNGRVIVGYMQRPHAPGNVLEVDLATAEHRLVVASTDFVEPAGVALEASGDVIVTEPDESGQRSRVHRLLRSGFQRVLREGPPGNIYGGVTVDPATGDILVADTPVHDTGKLVRFDATGQDMQTIATGGSLVFPLGVAVDHGGGIVVADGAKRVLRIDRAGGAQTVVSQGGSLESPTGLAIRAG